MSDETLDFTESCNANPGGYDLASGLRYVRATRDEVIAELEIGTKHHQPFGLVHGGVYAAMVETLCSVGASLVARADGKTAVGLENTTSFLRPVRSGKIRGRAVPLVTGKRTHVWQVEIHDDAGKLVATGRVRLLCVDASPPLPRSGRGLG
jgi:uncharacterized protein (TIGR00369 family)